jgi:hypothetical protein
LRSFNEFLAVYHKHQERRRTGPGDPELEKKTVFEELVGVRITGTVRRRKPMLEPISLLDASWDLANGSIDVARGLMTDERHRVPECPSRIPVTAILYCDLERRLERGKVKLAHPECLESVRKLAIKSASLDLASDRDRHIIKGLIVQKLP